jgi:hypothetical protein
MAREGRGEERYSKEERNGDNRSYTRMDEGTAYTRKKREEERNCRK